jgi:hypothetical protein
VGSEVVWGEGEGGAWGFSLSVFLTLSFFLLGPIKETGKIEGEEGIHSALSLFV